MVDDVTAQSRSGGRLAGRVAIVTGAGRGIGAAVARAMAAEGTAVIVNDLGVAVDGTSSGETPAEEVVRSITDAGGQARVDRTDVTDFAGCEALVRDTVDRYGKLDALVNVAGILRDRMVFSLDEGDWDLVVAVHLKGTFNTIRHASAYWRERAKREGGPVTARIVNFTSGSGLFGSPGQPNYAAAKMGVVGLTLSCANSLNRYGVRSNAIAPVARTRMTEDLRPDIYARQEMDPENVAPAAVYLSSAESAWLNGRVVWAGGGRLGLVSNPAIDIEVVRQGVWTMDETFEEFEATLKPRALGSGPFSS